MNQETWEQINEIIRLAREEGYVTTTLFSRYTPDFIQAQDDLLQDGWEFLTGTPGQSWYKRFPQAGEDETRHTPRFVAKWEKGTPITRIPGSFGDYLRRSED